MNKTLKHTLIVGLILYVLFVGFTIYSNHQITIQNQYTEPTGTLIDTYNRATSESTRIRYRLSNPFHYLIIGGLAFGGVKLAAKIRKGKTN